MRENNFFAMMSRMKLIDRWGLMRNTIKENDAEHSFDVAMIAHGLSVIANTYFGKTVNAERAALLALFHDTTEIITGDMPTPIKYFSPEIKGAYKNVESIAGGQLLGMLPEKMREVYEPLYRHNPQDSELWRYVKAADKLSALIKCIDEVSMGNMDFMQAKSATEKALKNMAMEEVDFFMERFLPAYSMTLDEQSEV